MPTWPLKLISAFMVLLGAVVLIALVTPLTGQFMNPKIPISITAAVTMVVGAGLFAQKKWSIYLFFISALVTHIANLVLFGQSLIGNSWIGILVISLVAGIYWKRLS